jgi:hypothetical protein
MYVLCVANALLSAPREKKWNMACESAPKQVRNESAQRTAIVCFYLTQHNSTNRFAPPTPTPTSLPRAAQLAATPGAATDHVPCSCRTPLHDPHSTKPHRKLTSGSEIMATGVPQQRARVCGC